MNKLFVAIAAIGSSGIFAFSYWKEWYGIFSGQHTIPDLTDDITPPYFHASVELYQQVLLIFAVIFSLICIFAVSAVLRKKWGYVMFAFSLSMLAILAVMINGAIK